MFGLVIEVPGGTDVDIDAGNCIGNSVDSKSPGPAREDRNRLCRGSKYCQRPELCFYLNELKFTVIFKSPLIVGKLICRGISLTTPDPMRKGLQGLAALADGQHISPVPSSRKPSYRIEMDPDMEPETGIHGITAYTAMARAKRKTDCAHSFLHSDDLYQGLFENYPHSYARNIFL